MLSIPRDNRPGSLHVAVHGALGPEPWANTALDGASGGSGRSLSEAGAEFFVPRRGGVRGSCAVQAKIVSATANNTAGVRTGCSACRQRNDNNCDCHSNGCGVQPSTAVWNEVADFADCYTQNETSVASVDRQRPQFSTIAIPFLETACWKVTDGQSRTFSFVVVFRV